MPAATALWARSRALGGPGITVEDCARTIAECVALEASKLDERMESIQAVNDELSARLKSRQNPAKMARSSQTYVPTEPNNHL